MLQNISISNNVLLNFLFIKESWKIQCITVSTKILGSTTVFNIDNNQKCFLSSKSVYYNDFWRSCDTEDWRNDAENTAAHHRHKLQFKMYWQKMVILKCINISHYHSFYCIFGQINAGLVSLRDFFQKRFFFTKAKLFYFTVLYINLLIWLV